MVLDGLCIGDDPGAWEALGFAVDRDVASIGGVHLRLAGREAGEGILGWHVAGLESHVLPEISPVRAGLGRHPNGVVGVDHVVAFAGDFDATVAALAGEGLEARRVRDVPGGEVRQAFYVLGTALLELAGPVEDADEPRFWGLTLVAEDLEALADRLGERLGPVKDAVQPGRRIATLRAEAGLSVPLAFMSPR